MKLSPLAWNRAIAPSVAALAVAFATPSAHGQDPEPIDQPYPGTLTLSVDVSNTAQRIFRVHEVIPASPGPLALRYPKWIPGTHSPSGHIADMVGVIATAGGQRVAWHRDLADMFMLHLDVPQGAKAVEVDFQYLSPTGTSGLSETIKRVALQWCNVALYPAGYFVRQIPVSPSVKLPAGWGYATALEKESESGGRVGFKTVSLEELVDSPLIAGANFKRVDLTPNTTPSVHLDIVSDSPENLAITPAQIAGHTALAAQAYALFGARHYAHYDFLLTLSDSASIGGLENHQSSDDRIYPDFFTDPDSFTSLSFLMPHEYVHSWNGKYRRPANLWTPDYNHVPMEDDLLWVYEGLTEYFGEVLTARSGLWTPEQFRNNLAGVASGVSMTPGRSWRTLQDTADGAQVLYGASGSWRNYRRSVDFYTEGVLVWLDVDTTIRERSDGARSLDDFARAFYGANDGSRRVVTYTFDDIVAALNKVQPLGWAAFLRQRLDSTDASAPLGGITRGGWRLAYSSEQTDVSKAQEKAFKYVPLMASIGFTVDAGDNAGTITDVLWQGEAFNAGLAPGIKLVAVNGEKYSAKVLKDAITSAKSSAAPIELIVQNGNTFSTVQLSCHSGLRYPRLERIENTPDRLAEITKPRT